MSEAYSEPCQTSKMELFATIVKSFQPISIFSKNSILDIWQVLNEPLHITKTLSSIINNILKDFDADIKTEFK